MIQQTQTTLTESQTQAVCSTAPDTLVVAGAGSGKTRVLSQRVARCLSASGWSASELLVLTFTRKAAGELASRVAESLDPDGHSEGADRLVRGMMLGTFHSVALGILRLHGACLGYNPQTITVIDPDDADLLLKQVCKDLGYLKGTKWTKELSWEKVRLGLDRFYRLEFGYEIPQTIGIDPLFTIIRQYRADLFHMNLLDFGAILFDTNRLFIEHSDVIARYREQIKGVLVDELQDSDEVQYCLHDHFNGSASFFGVGDTRQTIYRWRGARPDLMADKHPDADVIDLRECFRCGDRIVEAANKLIAHNTDETAKPMVGATGTPGAVKVINGRSANIANYVQDLRERGYAPSDIAVLARSHRQLRRLSDVFTERGIPHHRVGAAFDVTTTEEFRQIHACLRLAVNPRDNLAFLRLATTYMSRAEFSEVRALASEQGISHYTAACAKGVEWACYLATAIEETDEQTRPDLVAYQCARALPGYMPVHEAWLGPVDFWEDQCSTMTTQAALDWFALRDSQDDTDAGNKVILLTVHAAKGLEWPVVVMVNMNEGDFPSSRAISEDESGVPDERRLAYVGITRAKELCVLHYRRRCDQAQNRTIKPPSRFLYESGAL